MNQNYVGLSPHNDLWGVYSDDAPATTGRTHGPAVDTFLNHIKAAFKDRTTAQFIALALNLDGVDLSPAQFLELEAVYAMAEVSTKVEANTPDKDGTITLTTTKVAPNGRWSTPTIGMTLRGDGSSSADDAKTIVRLFNDMPTTLDQFRKKLFITRHVGTHEIILDANQADLFDGSQWVMDDDCELVDTKTGDRLADQIYGTDGHVLSAKLQRPNDFRLARLHAVDRRVWHRVMLTPDEIACLETLSLNTNSDQGRIIAGVLNHDA